MPQADIIDPLSGDTVTVASGGQITVTVYYNYPAPRKLRCFVDTDADAEITTPNRVGTHIGTITCTKPASTYNNVPVTTKTEGNPDDAESITLIVTGAAVVRPTVDRTNPLPPAALPAPGSGPIEFSISGGTPNGTAYVVCVAIEMSAGGGRTPLNGVCAKVRGDGTFGGRVISPNNPNCAYVARVIYFNAMDEIISKETRFLHGP